MNWSGTGGGAVAYHQMDVSGPHGVAVDGLEELVGGTVGGEGVGGRAQAVEPVLALVVGLELAAQVVVAVGRVLEVVLAVAAGLPHVEGDVGNGLVGYEVTNHTVHVGNLALVGILNDGVTELTPGSVGRPEGTEDGGGGGSVVGVFGLDVVCDFSDEAVKKVRLRMTENQMISSTHDSRPTRSHILCISLRLPLDSAQVLPTSLKKLTPSSHSSGVRSTSLVKSWRWRTAEAKICLKRGLVLGPQVSMTFWVKLGSYLWVAAGASACCWVDIVLWCWPETFLDEGCTWWLRYIKQEVALEG